MTKSQFTSHRRLMAAFTLVELMVVMVVVALLATLTLAGMSGVRDRAKADKTRSTIRKIHEIIVPQYESYLTRRIPSRATSPSVFLQNGRFIASGTTITASTVPATNRLWGLRLLMALEMPDQWSDVAPTTPIPSWMVTAPVKRYATLVSGPNAVQPSNAYEGAECLAMIVMRGGFDADLIESFRADEIGDVDGDKHPEFLDGWGKPIGFIRWPVGFISPVQPQNASLNPDPFDPTLRSGTLAFPPPNSTWPGNDRDYAVAPLIYSGGPDAALDAPVLGTSGSTPFYVGYAAARDISASASWVTQLLVTGTPLLASGTVPSIRTITSGSIGPGSVHDAVGFRDNITNFDFLKK